MVRPTILYGFETVPLTNRHEEELKAAELKMLSFSTGVNIIDKIKEEHIRETAHVGSIKDKAREARIRQHILRKRAKGKG